MIPFANILLFAVTVVLLVPVLVLCVECVAAVVAGRRREPVAEGPRPSVAVLVPAHDEELVIASTLATLKAQLGSRDRLVVVADNCTDRTAEVARDAGAEVVERHDPDHLGKGYALAHGIAFLAPQPPDVVVVIDADCRVEQGTLAEIAQSAAALQQPVQVTNLLAPPTRPTPMAATSALAFLVNNLVRPTGLRRLGLSCLLTGTGMAFPWRIIKDAPLASGNIVEDVRLGIDLTLAGHPPAFCESGRVTGTLPDSTATAMTQRTRWEHGHLYTLLTQVPRLLRVGIRQRRAVVVAMALDLCVPPLSLLVLSLVAAACAAVGGGAAGASWVPAAMLSGGLGALAATIFAAWLRFGRGYVPLASLLAAPLYVAWKAPIYVRFLFRREKTWVRTDRKTAES